MRPGNREWHSVEEVAVAYDLPVGSPLSELLKKLEEKRPSLHPDKTGGAFLNAEQEQLWHELDGAMSYVLEKAQEASRAIVPASDASRYLSPTPSASVVTFESRQLNLIDIGRRRASSQIRVPRVGSGVFAGISGTIFTVAPALPQHPFFATLVGTPGALSLLGMAFVASGVMFIATWIIEQTVDARIEFWASDDGLNAIARRLRHRYRDEGNELMFRRSEVINMIRGHAGIYRSIFPVFGLVSIDRQTAAGTADLQIEKMIAAGVAIPIAGRTLDPGFRLVDEEH